MLFPQRDDPTDARDPDEERMMGRVPRPLVWGLVKGVVMLGLAAAITYGAAMALQERAQDRNEQAATRGETDAAQVGMVPDAAATVPRPTDGKP
jgi:hypothetical protein